MKIISWNIQGLNSSQKTKILIKKNKRTNSTIVFIQETKFPSTQFKEIIKKIWKGSEVIGRDAIGYVGGLGTWYISRILILYLSIVF